MLLESLEADTVRNLSGSVSFGAGLNILYGENGQGKTNWLEAIYFLATTKSFRTQRPQEAVRFDAELGLVRGRVARSGEIQRDLQVAIQGNTKILSVNGKRESVARYLGQLHTVAFTADELEVVRGAPDARRRFLDRGVLSLHHAYVQTIADYSRVIKQKNRLLQNAMDDEMPLERLAQIVDPWNEQLANLSAEIYQARTDYVEGLNRVLENRLFGREEITIRYVSSLEGKGDLSDYRNLITERLRLRLPAELNAGYALIGTHRDDLEILFDGRNIRAFGSSGQQRSALLIIDLAAISVYHGWHSEFPLLLIDDVDAELDARRIDQLLEYVEGRTQTFLTTSKESLVKQHGARANVFEVSGGKIIGDGTESDSVSRSIHEAVAGLNIN
ncbi:MAG: DNA replication/repair protein RecF [Pyrinomonadaceae bacterium]